MKEITELSGVNFKNYYMALRSDLKLLHKAEMIWKRSPFLEVFKIILVQREQDEHTHKDSPAQNSFPHPSYYKFHSFRIFL